jgi:hypothetical protein
VYRAWIGHLHSNQCPTFFHNVNIKTGANVAMLGTVTPAPADVHLNLND